MAMNEQQMPPKDPGEALLAIAQALTGLSSAMDGTVSPEAIEHLQAAASEYNSFLQLMGKEMGVDMGAPPKAAASMPRPVDSARGAVPADAAPRGARPMPA